jgi:hypothetical protein
VPFDNTGLTFDAGRGIPHFLRTVIIGRRAKDNGVNMITIVNSVIKAFQHHDSSAIPANCTAGIFTEWFAMPIL